MADEDRTISERPRASTTTIARIEGTPLARFELGDEIARGGMGRVIEARDRVLGRYVAIKQVIDPDAETRQRFKRETAITARLEHPAIVPLYDAGSDDEGLPFYVMRRVDGQRLSESIGSAAGLEERLALVPNVLAACDAIGHAHRRGVIHRDLKPGNILIGDHGETIVIDWGLAKVVDDPEAPPDREDAPTNAGLDTIAGVVIGTPGYMPPEQLRGEPATTRTDVYALGATLYHALAGRPPHAASSSTTMLELAKAGPPPELETILPGVPRDLATIVATAMARDPAGRFETAAELASELRRFLTGQLVAAHRYSIRERVQRFIRRHRVAVAIAAASLITAGIIAAVSIGRVITARDHALDAALAAEQAQRQETERADELLVERARLLAPKSPLGAITQLHKLRPDSPSWIRAHGVLTEAATHGLPWLLPAGSLTVALTMTRDAGRAYSLAKTGELWLHDLNARSSTVIRRDPEATTLALADDDRVLVIGGKRSIVHHDLATGAETITPASQVTALTVAGRAFAWRDKAGNAFFAVSPEGEARALPKVEGLLTLSPDAKTLAVFGLGGTFVIDLEPIAVRYHHQGETRDARWSPDGSRLAIADRSGGFVLDGFHDTLRDTQRVSGLPRAALFAGTHVLFAGADGKVLRQGASVRVSGLDTLHQPHAAVAEHGAVFDTANRELVVVGPVTERAIRLPGTPLAVAAARARTVVAIPGRLLLYELSPMLPRIVAIPPSSFRIRIPFGDRFFLATAFTPPRVDWMVYDLDGGGAQSYGQSGMASTITSARDGSYIVFKDVDLDAFVMLRRGGRRHQFPPTVTRVFAASPKQVILRDGNRLQVFDVATEVATPLVEIEPSASLVAVSKSHVAIAHPTPPRLTRVEIATSARVEVASSSLPGALAVLGDTVYFARDREFMSWDGQRLVSLGSLPSSISRFAELSGRPIAVDQHGGTWVIEAGKPRRLLPARSRLADWSVDGTRAVTRSIDDELLLFDLKTGDRWELPLRAESVMLGASGTRLLLPFAEGIAVYELSLPTDAAAYARQLAGSTNLRVDDMDDVIWP